MHICIHTAIYIFIYIIHKGLNLVVFFPPKNVKQAAFVCVYFFCLLVIHAQAALRLFVCDAYYAGFFSFILNEII